MNTTQQLLFHDQCPYLKLTFDEPVEGLQIQVTSPAYQDEQDLLNYGCSEADRLAGAGVHFSIRLDPRPGLHKIHLQTAEFSLDLVQEVGFLRGPEPSQLVLNPLQPRFPVLLRNLDHFQWRAYSAHIEPDGRYVQGSLVTQLDQVANAGPEKHQLLFLDLSLLAPANYYAIELLAQGVSRGTWFLQTSGLGTAVLVAQQRRFQLVWELLDSSLVSPLLELPDSDSNRLFFESDQRSVWTYLPTGCPTGPVTAYAIATDRGFYQAGERLAVFGWVRQRPTPLHDLEIPDWDQVHVAGPGWSQTLDLTPLGGLAGQWTLPQRLADGYHPINLEFRRRGSKCASTQLGFQSGPYRRSEFEVKLDSTSRLISLQARNYSGEPVAGAEVAWTCSWNDGYHRPPGWEHFVFGCQSPPWWPHCSPPMAHQVHGQQRTDAQGQARFHLTGQPAPGVSAWLELQATVTAPNRLQSSGSSRLYLLASSICLGIYCRRPVLGRDELLELSLLVSDLQGQLLNGVEIELGWQEQVVEKVLSQSQPIRLVLDPVDWGGIPMQIWARAHDAQGQISLSSVYVWASSGEELPPQLQLVSSQASYQQGEVAEITVLSPLFPAQGVLLVSTGECVHHQHFHLTESCARFNFPILAGMRPEALVRVELFCGAEHLHAQLCLPISLDDRRLHLELEAPTQAGPDSSLTVQVRVSDAAGQPCCAEVMIVAVDQAALDYAEHPDLDPLTALHQQPSAKFQLSTNLHSLVPRQLEPRRFSMVECSEACSPPGEGGGVLSIRVNFNPLAFCSAALKSDEHGRLECTFQLPSSLTRYQISAFACQSPAAFGQARCQLTCHASGLSLRPVVPLFVWQNDQVQIPIVVSNAGPQVESAHLFARGAGCQVLQPAWEFEIAAQGTRELRVEVRFPSLGQACLQWALPGQDACQSLVPVRALPRRLAASLAGQSAQGILTFPLEIQADARAHLELEFTTPDRNALIFNRWWKPNWLAPRLHLGASAGQLLAAVIAWDMSLVQRDPAPLRAQAQLSQDAQKLLKLQQPDGQFHSDGGWSPSSPAYSLYCIEALLLAEVAGVSLPPAALERLRDYLEKLSTEPPPDPALSADLVRARAYRLLQRWDPGPLPQRLGPDPTVSLELAASDQAHQWLASLEISARDAVSWQRPGLSYEALLWSTLGRLKLAQSILEPLQRGIRRPRWPIHQCRWSHSVENQILAQEETEVPKLKIEIHADQRPLGQLDLAGWNADRRFLIPLQKARRLTFSLQGQGRVHYRIRLVQLDDQPMQACQRGFALKRSYLGQDEEPLPRDAQGAWIVPLGQWVHVEIKILAFGYRCGMLMCEPYAAGLEPEPTQIYVRPWKDRTEMRSGYLWIEAEEPDVVDKYYKPGDKLVRQIGQVNYSARAILPGLFQIPSCWAEEPGYPETRGQTGPDCLRIE